MRLKSVRIRNYKCILDSGPVQVDQVTFLVGKNESGKSAILEALARLNPLDQRDATFSEEDFPRRYVSTSRERGEIPSTEVLSTTWELDESDVAVVAELAGDGVLTANWASVVKRYDNQVTWDLPLDEQVLVKRLLDEAHLSASERSQLNSSSSVLELGQRLSKIQDRPHKLTSLLTSTQKKLGGMPSLTALIASALAPRLPKFLYFRDYDKLPGKVSLTEIKKRKKEHTLSMGDRIFEALLELANTSIADIESIGKSETFVMELEAVRNRLTEELMAYWTQNKFLEVEFRYDEARPQDPPPFNDGVVMSTRILNRRHRATVNFDERSTGFIWFFSFLVWFSRIKQTYGDNVFILLDEPGLTLHGAAQKDLLRYINERLRPHHQVVYTTHSPFMIDNENIFSLRTVEDIVERDPETGEEKILGTRVGHEVLSRDRDTILPLQGTIGLDIANTLFLGPYVLVTEGPSDAAYISWFSRSLIGGGRAGLDVRWAVAPAESASTVSSFVTLFHGRGLEIAALMDYHEGQKGLVDKLDERNLLKPGRLIRTTELVAQDEADIEDVLGRELYVELVNHWLEGQGAAKLPEKRGTDTPVRVVKEVEEHCKMLPPGVPEFDHYLPVRLLMSLPGKVIASLPGYDAALDRFEKLFESLNAHIA